MSRNRGFGVIGGGGGGGGGVTRNGNDFVYQPGGVAGGNVYTSQATLNAAVAAARGARRILIDTTMGPAVWDATMDFGTEQGPVEVLGTDSVVATTALEIATGANLRGVSRWTDIAITVTSTSAVCDGPVAADITVEFAGNTSVICTGGAPLIMPTRVGASEIRIVMDDDASLDNGGYAVVEVPALMGIRADARDRSQINANTLKGSGRGNYVSRHGSYATASATQVGTVWNYQEFTAIGVSYDPNLIAEGMSATSVQGAIDYLKQQVWRASDYVAADPAAALAGAAFTVGARIRVNRVREALGIRIAWHRAVLGTVTCRLRTVAGGTVIATATVDVDVAGVYYAEFAAPVDLSTHLGVALSVDAYDGTDYWYATDAEHPTMPFPLDAGITHLGYYAFAGNGMPNVAAAPDVYGVDLVTRGASLWRPRCAPWIRSPQPMPTRLRRAWTRAAMTCARCSRRSASTARRSTPSRARAWRRGRCLSGNTRPRAGPSRRLPTNSWPSARPSPRSRRTFRSRAKPS